MWRLGPDGGLSEFVPARAGFRTDWSFVRDAGGVHVARYATREVLRVAPDGTVIVAAHSPFPWAPTGGTFGQDGALWLLEASPTNAVRVRRIAKDGRVTTY